MPNRTFAHRLYAKLLRLYPRPHRERFAEGMRQTFNDLYREQNGRNLTSIFLDTFASALKARISFTLATMRTSFLRVAAVTACLLVIPMLGNRFVDGWNWDTFDFVWAGTVIFGAGMCLEIMFKQCDKLAYRLGVALAVLTSFMIIWVNAAVGIIGDGNMAANFMYLGVVLLGLISAMAARFQPHGMMLSALVVATALALVPVAALFFIDTATWGAQGVPAVFMLNSCLVGNFLLASAMFRKATNGKSGIIGFVPATR